MPPINYEPANMYMARIPLQHTEFSEKYSEISEEIEDIKADKYFNEQLLVASSNLYRMLHNSDLETLSEKKRRQLISSLLSYQNRASFRTTPFGLFSGTALQYIGENIEESIVGQNESLPYKKHCRVDIEWLMSLVKNIIREEYSCFEYKLNRAYYKKGDRNYLLYNTGGTNSEITILDSNPFYIIENSCSDSSKSFKDLFTKLKFSYPDRDESVLENYLWTLIEKEFLISELTPPLCNTDELNHIIEILKKYPILQRKYCDSLVELQKMIINYEQTEIGEGIGNYKDICSKMSELHNYEGENYLQVDCEIKIEDRIIDDIDIKSMKKFINFIFNLGAIENNDNPLNDYGIKFAEKYGEYLEVPIYELLDESIGIGAPIDYLQPKNEFNDPLPRNRENVALRNFFMEKYTEAIKSNNSIILTDAEFGEFTQQIDHGMFPDSLEMNFIVKNIQGIKHFYLGPNVGSPMAGKTMGRFGYTSSLYKNLIEDIYKKMPRNEDYDSCELSFVPYQMRSGNVTRNISVNEKNLCLFTNSYDPENEVKLKDVLVGCHNGVFYLKDASTNRKIRVTTNNMLNRILLSNPLRLMQDISLMQGLFLGAFPWVKYFKDLSYIPEIKYENIIISCEKWKISNDSLHLKSKFTYKDFSDRFLELKQKLSIPDMIYYKEADNRLLLDLKKEKYWRILYENFKKRNMVELEKSEEGEYVIKKINGKYATEVVVPFIKGERITKKNEYVLSQIRSAKDNSNIYLPFDKWLYIKLYGPLQRQEELIKYLNHIISEIIADFDIDEFFFMRYADPKPHVRLRIKADKESLFVIVVRLNGFIQQLQEKYIVSSMNIDTYIPETERYGGEELIFYAESIFSEDSRVVMDILNNFDLERYKEKIGVISIIHYLNSFGLSFDEQLQFLSKTRGNKEFKKSFSQIRKEYMKEIDANNGWEILKEQNEWGILIEILNKRLNSTSKFIKKLRSIKEGTNNFEDIIGSIIHLHCNRMFGIDREFENKILFYAGQTLNGQKHLKSIILV